MGERAITVLVMCSSLSTLDSLPSLADNFSINLILVLFSLRECYGFKFLPRLGVKTEDSIIFPQSHSEIGSLQSVHC